MYGNKVYDALLDETFHKDEISLEYWINLLRENTLASYTHGIKSIDELQKFLRECVYSLSTLLESKESTKFMLEYEKRFSNNLLNEDIEDFTNILTESWDFIGITLFEQESTWEKIKSGASNIFSKVKSGISQAWNYIKEKGAPWFFENMRKALYSWGGVAVQAFLAHPSIQVATGGITTGLIITIWGAMLAYDTLEALEGRPNWVNLIIDIVSLLTLGVGGKAVQGAAATIPKSSSGSLSKVLNYLKNTSIGKWLVGILGKASSSLSNVLSLVGKGIAWVGEKLGITSLKNASSRISGFIEKTFSQLSNFASKAAKPVGAGVVGGGVAYGFEKALGGEGKMTGGAFENDKLSASDETTLSKAFKNIKSSATAGEDYPEY
jgi:hypothetical protein